MTTGTAATRTGGDEDVVVAVDGSPSSQEALHWALRQARLTGHTLRAVTAWHWPDMYGQGGFGFGYAAPLELDLHGDATKMLAQVVAELPDEDVSGVDIQQVVLEGSAVPVLLAQAEHASLLVLGSRGHGAFTGMLIGSVSEHCVSHAACPVVVVREPQPVV